MKYATINALNARPHFEKLIIFASISMVFIWKRGPTSVISVMLLILCQMTWKDIGCRHIQQRDHSNVTSARNHLSFHIIWKTTSIKSIKTKKQFKLNLIPVNYQPFMLWNKIQIVKCPKNKFIYLNGFDNERCS